MWMNQDVPHFDFLLIDIRFNKDTSDPLYFSEALDTTQNPLGLLHALPLVGQLTSSRMPFVWGIHSSAKESVVDDPVATICYGLLCAMDHANQPDLALEKEFQESKMNVSRFFKDRLLNDQSVTDDPQGTIRRLVSKYRRAFSRACQDKLALNYGRLDQICANAQDFLDGKSTLELIQEGSITVGTGLMSDDISLLSFFADVTEWTQDTVAHIILPELRKLQETQKYTDIYPTVVKCMDQLDPDKGSSMKAADVVGKEVQVSDSERYGRVCVAVILCACLRLLHNQWRLEGRAGSAPKFKTSSLTEELGYPPGDMKWADNRLKTFFGNSMRPTIFRDMLCKNTEWHGFLRQCGVKYWGRLNEGWKQIQLKKGVHESEIAQFRLPECLVAPRDYMTS
jgi:hypothetical protein